MDHAKALEIPVFLSQLLCSQVMSVTDIILFGSMTTLYNISWLLLQKGVAM